MASWEEEETEGIRAVGMRILRKTTLDFLLVLGWEFSLVFPDASHSYSPYAFLPLPFGLCDGFTEKIRDIHHNHKVLGHLSATYSTY